MKKEQQARLKINKLLEQSGWRLLDDENGRHNVEVEPGVTLEQLGDDFERAPKGFIDYLLQDDDGFPVCVLEAKSEEKDPLVGKEQARKYANSQKVRFVILSNGNLHYFWDKETGNPLPVSRLPSLADLKLQKKFEPDSAKLVNEEIKDDYVVLTQKPSYRADPRWEEESKRNELIEELGLRFLRPYQIEAVKKLQTAVADGKNRFLFEMATGTGKTLTAAAIIKLYLRTKNARRVLFLVDRLELETQTNKAFGNYLKGDYSSVVLKKNRDDWQKADIVVTTIQSISYNNKYLKDFLPTDFDLVISDEAHRSISGNSRAIFEYFIGHKLGLTATPKDYLKNVDEKKLADTDPREFERRELLSTYKTFGCESGTPTYRYSLADGVRDGYLVDPVAIDCRTDITTQLLSEEGYAVQTQTDENEEEETIFKQRDFERRFFSEGTNRQFVETFIKNAEKDQLSGEVGKTLVFCVSRRHASKITQLLNEFAHQVYPGKYQSDFAVQVTSDIQDAQQMTISFVNNNLNGRTNFLEDYKSSRTRVCVTVGMMTTGYDCEDILNICLMRPIFSPTEFVQMKGRGTRKYIFKHVHRAEGQELKRAETKSSFKLFDFFANCEYFEKEFPYGEVLKLPPAGTDGPTPPPPPPPPVKDVRLDQFDPLKMMEVLDFDGNVMRIDRELYASKFEQKVKEIYNGTAEFKAMVDGQDYEQMEAFVKEQLFNKPTEYFTLDTLRQSYVADRRLGLWEILDKVFGRITKFRSKDELAEEEFERFLVGSGIPSELYYEAREIFKTYLVDEDARTRINKRDYASFGSDQAMFTSVSKLGRHRLDVISGYIKDNVNLNRYLS